MQTFVIKSIFGDTLYTTDAETLREAVEKAVTERVSLRNASLDGASLDGASLRNASLDGASLDGAYGLSGDVLNVFRDDIRKVLDAAPNEAAGLLTALNEGKVDGSMYEGECACLIGTIAKVRGCSYEELGPGLEPQATRPAERWFMRISKGATPRNNPDAALTSIWIEDWLEAHAAEQATKEVQ